MKIIRTKIDGFCPSVRKAYETAMVQEPGTKLSGQLIHNANVSRELEDHGIVEIKDSSEVKNGETILIRAHGATKKEWKHFREKNAKVIDCTCPNVDRILKLAQENNAQDKRVAVFGEPGHSEFNAIVSFAGDDVIALGSPEDANNVADNIENLILIGQTTANPAAYEEVKEILHTKCKNLESFETLCPYTRTVQESAIEVAKLVNLMLIIGGKNSSNTKNLAKNCGKIVETHHIQGPNDLDTIKIDSNGIIGIAAGASTPERIVEEVVKALEEI
jgi:(E)-4-hydroxy-3-methyl-but-2-enyl pyrophosphate reductase